MKIVANHCIRVVEYIEFVKIKYYISSSKA